MKGGQSLREYVRDARDPTLLVVVLEDSAALTSIVVAVAGLWLTQTSGRPVWDGVASMVIGVILLAVAVFLALESYSLLLGETAPRDVESKIRGVVSLEPAVDGLEALHTMHVGPDSLLIALSVAFRRDLTAGQVADAVQRMQQAIRDELSGKTSPLLILIEPAHRRAA